MINLDTVGEGIESVEQARWLLAHGVEFGQGFLYSRPIPAQAFRAYLQANQRALGTTSAVVTPFPRRKKGA